MWVLHRVVSLYPHPSRLCRGRSGVGGRFAQVDVGPAGEVDVRVAKPRAHGLQAYAASIHQLPAVWRRSWNRTVGRPSLMAAGLNTRL